jgi:hypothetical protein
MRRWALVVLANWLLLEAGSFAGLWYLARFRNIHYDPNPVALTEQQRTNLTAFVRSGHGARTAQDPQLGWVPSRETNSAGMRDDREYTLLPPPGVVRIAAFGDSFTYGADVKLAESWTRQLADADPALEVLNYGAGAYGTDQAYLRYRKAGADYQPHIVLIGYMSENLARCVNVFRGFYSSSYRDTIFSKPRFRLINGQLELLPNPMATVADHETLLRQEAATLARLGEHDFHYQNNYSHGLMDVSPAVRLGKMLWWRTGQRLLGEPIFHTFEGSYNARSEAYAVTLSILDQFYRDVRERGALPVIVVFPDMIDLERSRRGRPPRYTGFLDHFRRQGYRFIDTGEVLRASQQRYRDDQLTVDWGHYSPLGSKIVAEEIRTRLREQGLLDPAALRQRLSVR